MPPIIQTQPPSFLPRQRLYLPFSGLNPPHASASPPAPGDPRARPALRSELPDVRTCPAQRLALWDELFVWSPPHSGAPTQGTCAAFLGQFFTHFVLPHPLPLPRIGLNPDLLSPRAAPASLCTPALGWPREAQGPRCHGVLLRSLQSGPTHAAVQTPLAILTFTGTSSFPASPNAMWLPCFSTAWVTSYRPQASNALNVHLPEVLGEYFQCISLPSAQHLSSPTPQ